MTMQTTFRTRRRRACPSSAPTRRRRDIDVDVEAELRAFEEAERERLGIKAERRQWVDNMLKPEDDEERARQRDAPHQRAHRRAGLPHRGGAPRARLQGRVLRHEQQRGAPGRQGVRQPRPVQPDLLHGRRPGEAPHRSARQAGHDRRGDRRRTTSSSPPARAARAASACT